MERVVGGEGIDGAAGKFIRLQESSEVGSILPGDEVVEAGFGISFLVGEKMRLGGGSWEVFAAEGLTLVIFTIRFSRSVVVASFSLPRIPFASGQKTVHKVSATVCASEKVGWVEVQWAKSSTCAVSSGNVEQTFALYETPQGYPQKSPQ